MQFTLLHAKEREKRAASNIQPIFRHKRGVPYWMENKTAKKEEEEMNYQLERCRTEINLISVGRAIGTGNGARIKKSPGDGKFIHSGRNSRAATEIYKKNCEPQLTLWRDTRR
jgi:hypothetical protein